jgi:hypothetical protein
VADKKKLPDRIEQCLKSIVEEFEKEDVFVRQRQLIQARQLKLLWAGFSNIWYSEVAHDWRIGNDADYVDVNSSAYYDKPVNVYRAYLESIIAALSAQVPTIQCAPDDVDNPLDTATAKAGDKIAELVYKHNDAPLLFIHALFLFCTEGMVAAYNYTKSDKKYGTYTTNNYEDDEVSINSMVCPVCKTNLPDDALSHQEMDEFDPDDDDAMSHNIIPKEGPICPQCMVMVDPEIQTEKIIVPRLAGTTTNPKSRQCVEAYGLLNVKIPVYARRFEESPYLKYSYEVHYSKAIECYPNIRNTMDGNSKITGQTNGMTDYYERWARLPTQYYGDWPRDNATINHYWLRPFTYNVLKEDDDVADMKKKFPDGVHVVFVGDQFAEACNENVDDHWTITKNPLSDYIHYDPIGLLLTSIQEITNEIISLVLQTVEHGIPQTFADPSVVDFNAYRNTEATPGAIYPVKNTNGKPLSEAFYEVKTAALSQEVLPFADKINELGQLTSGALPSLFGGAQPNSSKTAAQYSMSRTQALQRLQTPWKMFTFWWKEIFSKVIPAYIKSAVDDEKFTKKNNAGNYINVFIRKAELEGNIGDVELEASEQLPMTWAAMKEAMMQLMQGANPEVMQALMDPENLPFVKQTIGLVNLSIPGEDDRQKQYEEIQLLVQSTPIPGPDGQMQPSVDVDPNVDNNALEADICRRWAVSDAGRLCKQENPDGYTNVLLHMKRHIDLQQAMMAMQAAQMSPGQPNAGPNSPQGQPKGPTNSPNQAPNPAGDDKGSARPMAAPIPRKNNAVTIQ